MLRRGAELVGAAIFAVMFGAFMLQVFSRYVLNQPLGWTEELALIAYVWGTFWACAFMLSETDHVRVDLVYEALPARGRRLCALAGTLLIVGLFAAALPAIWDYVTFMRRERTWILGVRFDYVFFCFVLFVLATVIAGAAKLARLAGRNWRDAL